MSVIDCIKDWLEVFYYIMFIILTLIIVFYTKKSYELESSRKYDLLCKFTVPNPDVEYNVFSYFLEIYNAGNLVANNVNVTIQGKYLTTIDFVKPGSVELFPLGMMDCMLDRNRPEPGLVNAEPGEKINVTLLLDDNEQTYTLDTDILFALRPRDSFNSNIDRHLSDIAKQLREANLKKNSIIK